MDRASGDELNQVGRFDDILHAKKVSFVEKNVLQSHGSVRVSENREHPEQGQCRYGLPRIGRMQILFGDFLLILAQKDKGILGKRLMMWGTRKAPRSTTAAMQEVCSARPLGSSRMKAKKSRKPQESKAI